MDYQDVLTIFFTPSPPETPQPAIVRQAGAARRLRDAMEPIAMHAVWCRPTNEALANAYGLDFLGSYVWGRASALGEPSAAVVVSAFAVFEPNLVTTTYDDARRKASWADLVATRDGSTATSLRDQLGEVELAPVTAALRRAIETADPAGRPLFAGLAGRDWPADPYGQLWRACDILREHRGDSHVAACVAAGLTGPEMNILTELWLDMPLFSYAATRGWAPDRLNTAADRLRTAGLLEGDQLSPAGRAFRDAIEASTDAAQAGIITAIGDDLAMVTERLTAWSDQLIAGHAFPPSVHKRAAG